MEEPAAGEAVWFAHEKRIQRLEEVMGDFGRAMVKVEQDIERNNILTSQIRDDTREIRDLVRGGKAFGKLFAWFGGAIGFMIAAYTLNGLIK